MSRQVKMNPERKAQWTAKLRSGEVKQGGGQLRGDGPDGALFCCLGVACELAVEAGVIPPPSIVDGYWTYGDEAGRSWSDLPPTVRVWLGIDDKDPYLGAESASIWNDGEEAKELEPLPFDEIADLIDEHL